MSSAPETSLIICWAFREGGDFFRCAKDSRNEYGRSRGPRKAFESRGRLHFLVETLLPEPRSPASVITSAVVPAIRCGMILRHPYTRRCWAIRKNIVNRFSTRLILTLSVLTFLSFGDVIQAGSLGAFLRAFAHSHRHHRSHSSNRERPELNSQPETQRLRHLSHRASLRPGRRLNPTRISRLSKM